MSTRRTPGRVVLSRDTVSFALGWYLMLLEAHAYLFGQTFNPTVFVAGTVAAGLPGALDVWRGRRGPTAVPSVSSPEQPSSQEAPS